MKKDSPTASDKSFFDSNYIDQPLFLQIQKNSVQELSEIKKLCYNFLKNNFYKLIFILFL